MKAYTHLFRDFEGELTAEPNKTVKILLTIRN